MSDKKQDSGAGDNAGNHPADEVKQHLNFTAVAQILGGIFDLLLTFACAVAIAQALFLLMLIGGVR